MQDIRFKKENWNYSSRVAGILVHEGKVLLHNTFNGAGYAFPGGHITLGETGSQALQREFAEELDVEIKVQRLAWLGEIFFPQSERTCHQVCQYYEVQLTGKPDIPLFASFPAPHPKEGSSFEMVFTWVSLSKIDGIELYPAVAKEWLHTLDGQIRHFIDREQDHADSR